MQTMTPQEFSEQLFALGYAHPAKEQLVCETMAFIAQQWQTSTLYLTDQHGQLLFQHNQSGCSSAPEMKDLAGLHRIELSDTFFLLSDKQPQPDFTPVWGRCFAKQLHNYRPEEPSLSSHNVMQLVMDHIPTRVFWKNTQQEYVGGNQAFLTDAQVENHHQLRGSRLQQMPWSDHNRSKFSDQDQLLLSGQKESVDFEEALEVAGQIQWIQGHKQIIRDTSGQITGILGTYHDISARKQDEEKLRLLATAFESHEGIVIADHNGVILEMNAAFCEITGYSPEEIAGKTFQVLHSGRQNQQFYREMWQSIHERGRWEGEIWNKRKNGEIYPEWLTITAVKNDFGETTHYVGAFVDLSEIKAQQAEIRRAAAQEQLIGQLFQLTLQGSSIRHYLHRVLELILESLPWLMSIASVHLAPQKPEDDWRTLAKLNIVSDSNLANHPDLHRALEKLAEEKSSQTLLSCRYCDQVPAHSHILIPLILDNELIGATVLTMRAFDNHNEEDEKLLYRLCNVIALGINRRQTERALITAKEDAERANVAKSQFLSSMSHELRTPLNAILGFAQLLELEDLDETQEENVTEIVNAGRHLLELINEVLDLAKIEAGRIDLALEKVDIYEALRECLMLTQPLADKRQIQIIHSQQTGTCAEGAQQTDTVPAGTQQEEANQTVFADRMRIKQILLNLLSNAVKYNRDGGDIRIEISIPEADTLRVSVQDTGLGIAEDKQGDIFQPFHRLGAEALNIEGTGIGLVISQKLANNMGGELGFVSQEGQGSNFWLDIPLYQEQKESQTQYQLLYIEDSSNDLKQLQQILQLRPEIQLFHTASATEGLTMLNKQPVDLVLLGVSIPDMNRFELLSEIKLQDTIHDIPVFAILADTSIEATILGVEAGFDECIRKPVEVQPFLDRLDSWLPDANGAKTGQNK